MNPKYSMGASRLTPTPFWSQKNGLHLYIFLKNKSICGVEWKIPHHFSTQIKDLGWEEDWFRVGPLTLQGLKFTPLSFRNISMADFEKHLNEIFLRVLFSPTFENPDHKHEGPFACWIKTDFFGPELPASSRVIDPISTAQLLLYSFASQLSLVAFSLKPALAPVHLRPPFFTWHLLTYQTHSCYQTPPFLAPTRNFYGDCRFCC